jgi:hypothetical protein
LAAVLELEPVDLLQLAGYGTQVGAAQYAQLFSVDRLDPETFERFVEYLLILLYPDADVQRAGSSGHKQDGLDTTVAWPRSRAPSKVRQSQNCMPKHDRQLAVFILNARRAGTSKRRSAS